MNHEGSASVRRPPVRRDGEPASPSPRVRFPRSVEVNIANSQGGRVIDVEVKGELDAFTLPSFEERMLSLISVRQPTVLRFDLGGVTFGGAGLVHAFAAASGLVQEFGGRLELANLSPSLRRVLGASSDGRAVLGDTTPPAA